MEDLDRFKLDAQGNLYWDGKRVNYPWQRLGAILVTVAAVRFTLNLL